MKTYNHIIHHLFRHHLRLCLLWVALFTVFAQALGQTPPKAQLPQVIPPSPQAESIKLHGEYGINYYTGIPDISIPLFEINHYGYTLPVSLKYYPQPLKPGMNYDVFGHGWGLSVNSCVSRTIKYAPDELKNFKIADNTDLSKYYETSKNSINTFNLEHDYFNATLPDGSSFDFVIDRDYSGTLQYIVSNGRNVLISQAYTTGNITSFTIIDENGVKYTFSEGDAPYMSSVEFGNSNVSWQLSRIDLPNAPGKPLVFNYGCVIQAPNSSFPEATFFIRHRNDPTPAQAPDKYEAITSSESNHSSYRMRLLSYIGYGDTGVSFTFKNATGVAQNYVKEIRVKDNSGFERKILLEMKEGVLSATGAPIGVNTVAKLKSLEILNTEGSSEKYTFNYGAESYFSFTGLDHWGNYNSQSTNYNLAFFNAYFEFNPLLLSHPSITLLTKEAGDKCPYFKVRLSKYPADNRQPGVPNSHGVLTKITYPTGGYTVFDFENNRCLTSTDYSGNYIHNKNGRRLMDAGGFRIASLTNYTADGSVTGKKIFCYGKSNYQLDSYNEMLEPLFLSGSFTGAGEPVVDPNVLTYANFTSIRTPGKVNDMLIGLDEYGAPFNHSFNPYPNASLSGQTWQWDCYFSASNFRRLLDGRPSVVYPEVTVFHGNIGDSPNMKYVAGKTVYKYDVFKPQQYDTAFFEKPKYYGNVLFYESHAYRHNTLKEKLDYMYTDNGYLLKQKETYQYSAHTRVVSDYFWINTYPDGFHDKYTTIYSFVANKQRYLGINKLIYKVTTVYDGSATGIKTTEDYGYNIRDQLNVITTRNSNNVSRSTQIVYPEIQSYGTTPAVVEKMVEKNIISPVLQSITFAGANRTGTKIDYAEYSFGSTTMLLPAKSYNLEMRPRAEGFFLQEEILRYSANGNPIERVTNDGIRTIYLWSYNDRYPVTEIRNTDYATVNSALAAVGLETIEALSNNPNPDKSKLDLLRNQTSLNDAAITTWKYQPLVGVVETTDPAGVTLSYEYDAVGRLKRTKDTEGKTLQQYNYNYINQ